MTRANLILDRYEPIGTAGSGGFGTVEIAWDPRIQRKVAIKTILLTEQDAYRAGLPGAQAISHASDTTHGAGNGYADRWHGVQPWDDYLAQEDARQAGYAGPGAVGRGGYGYDHGAGGGYDGYDAPGYGARSADVDTEADADAAANTEPETFHALANLPGLDEARTAAMLSDPRIVTVFDFEVRGREAYLIMEYIEGITLTKLLRDYADWLTLDVVAAVFDAVAGALTIAHEKGVLHLDIKPDNILINEKGEVKVTDFGLATLADASGAGTTGGGTIGYMPLEQMRREHLDARTDEWSLASVTYEMLTGENPFLAKNLAEAEAAIEDAELILPSLCWEAIDEQIDDVVFYALDPDREERYASVADFAEEADKFLGDAAAGKQQLVAIVGNALKPAEEEDEPEEEDAVPVEPPQRANPFGMLKSLFARPSAKSANALVQEAPRNAVQFDALEDDLPVAEGAWEEEAAAERSSRRSQAAERVPLRDRMGERPRIVLSRLFAAGASGFLAYFAANNLTALEAFGSGQFAVVIAIAIAVGALALVRPHIGALLAFPLVAIALVMHGGVVPAVVLLVALAAWWYFIARTSDASANAGLAAPLAGSVGGSSAVPLLAGFSLPPLQAVATTAFAAVCALALASLGSGTLLGWNAQVHWVMGDTDATRAFLRLLTQASTWCTIAGWLAASLVQSLLSTHGRRWMQVLGLACAVALVAVGSIAFAAPSVQLVVSLAIAAAGLLVVTL